MDGLILLFTFITSPVCDVAQTSDGGIPIIYFCYRPCLWCRSDVRWWHICYLHLLQALSAMSLRRPTVAFLLKPFMWCRSDARLWHFFYKPCLWRRSDIRQWYFLLSPLCGVAKTPDCGVRYLFIFLSRCRFRHPIGFTVIMLGFRADYRRLPFYLPVMPVLFIVH